METVGWIAAICLGGCTLPFALDGILKKSKPMNLFFLTSWFVGEIFGLIYTFSRSDWPLFTNYLVNVICILLWFSGFRKR